MNGLLLNPDKTEAMFRGTSRNLSKVKDQTVINISGSDIKPSEHIKSLGVTIDAKINFDQHVSNICRASFANIRALRQIRPTLNREDANKVACAIVSSRLDYCNSVLYGVSGRNISKLQRVQNALAKVVSGRRKFDHISPVLRQLHWLPVKERIDFKIAHLTFKAKLTGQLSYIFPICFIHINLYGHSVLQFRTDSRFPLSKLFLLQEHSLLQLPRSGTNYLIILRVQIQFRNLVNS